MQQLPRELLFKIFKICAPYIRNALHKVSKQFWRLLNEFREYYMNNMYHKWGNRDMYALHLAILRADFRTIVHSSELSRQFYSYYCMHNFTDLLRVTKTREYLCDPSNIVIQTQYLGSGNTIFEHGLIIFRKYDLVKSMQEPCCRQEQLLSMELTMHNKPYGVFISFYGNGKLMNLTLHTGKYLMSEFCFQMLFEKSGLPSRTGYYKHGRLHGKYYLYEHGYLKKVKHYIDGEEHGPYIKLHKNGEYQSIGEKQFNKRVGKYYYFDESGQKLHTKWYTPRAKIPRVFSSHKDML